MKRVEKAFVIIFSVSLIYKYFQGIGSSLFLIMAINLLAILYFYFSFALFNELSFKQIFNKNKYTSLVKKRLAISILTGIAISVSLIGILFKLQNYPGADFIMLIGLALTMTLTIFTLYKNYKTEGDFYFKILARVGLASLLLISLFKIPERTLLEWQYPDSPEYIDAVIKSRDDPRNDSLRELKKAEYLKLNDRIEKENN